LVDKRTRDILDASAVGNWQVPSFAEIVDFVGDAEAFPWPHPNGPSACRLVAGAVVANAAVVVRAPKVSTDDLIAALEKKALLTRADVEAEKISSNAALESVGK
jgi:hypothetical protein